MVHKHSQEMSEAFFVRCCYGAKLANWKDMHQLLHMVSSERTQVNLQNLAGLELLGFARSWLHGTWWAPKGPKQVHSENGLLEMMADLKRPSSSPLVKLEKVLDLGSSKRAQVFFFQEGPGMNKVEQYGERPFWLNEMRHWAFFKSNTWTRKREWQAWF